MLKYKSCCVDFDHTITKPTTKHYPQVYDDDLDMDAIEVLKEYKKRGGILVLFSCRSSNDLRIAVDACSAYGLEFDAVNCDAPQIIEDWREKHPGSTLSVKPYVDLYIDDRAWPNTIRGIDWYVLGRELLTEVEDE